MPGLKKVLVVDDNQINRQVLCLILKDEYQTVQAANGREALDYLKKQGEHISLILLDIGMPVMDGFAFLEAVKPDPILSSIPIIVTTSNDSEEDEIRCLAAGASDFITKPYKPEVVRHRVASIVRLRESAAILNLLEYDQLTGLYSKEFFYRHVTQRLEQNPGESYDMLCCDINKFKLVNERYGVEKGDELLRFIAQRMTSATGTSYLCGRIGADIFAILARHRDTYSEEAFSAWIDKTFIGAPVPNVEIKFGIYMDVDRTLPVSGMCDRAMLALNRIKDRYNLRISCYDDSLRVSMLKEQRILDNMRQGLEEHQFKIYLQPKYDIQHGVVAGAEALCRWVHPEYGLLSPGEFIPLFERSGFITSLDEYMWEGTCQILHDWQAAGRTIVPISVNVSRVCFDMPDLPERIRDLADKYAIPHDLLHLEVTESAYMDNPDQIVAVVKDLRAIGFKIEMDDFGAGYSSLNMLSKLPIDLLKLDMSFLHQDDTYSHKSILAFIVSLSKWLNLETIAEGVETSAQVEQLRSMGCRYIQGYYYSRPIPLKDFERYLDRESVAAQPLPTPTPLPEVELPLEKNDRYTVLVVEDMAINREILRRLLTPHYHVELATNGEEGLAFLKAHPLEVDVILLDLMMPIMDGFEMLDRVLKDDAFRRIPVIISSEASDGSELRALRLGADNFIAKPYQPEILLHHLQSSIDGAELKRMREKYERQQSELTHAAYRDSLTSLYNRRGMYRAVDHLFPGTHTVFMLDLDNLKACNDTYGHDCGDKLLAKVAATLKIETRDGDILARIGGDEFLIIARDMSDPRAVLKKGERICAVIAALGDCGCHPSCSIGAAQMYDTRDFKKTWRLADHALYRAKRTQKGSCCLWEEEMEND